MGQNTCDGIQAFDGAFVVVWGVRRDVEAEASEDGFSVGARAGQDERQGHGRGSFDWGVADW